MQYQPSFIAIAIFLFLTAGVMALSFYLSRRARSANGYFAAHGEVHWLVNGVALAGDYLSAASFLGICGMIAFYGYDGFLYSIGYLAGWVVALFIIAEPIRRLGKYTFADAVDATFHSRGVKLAAAVSTLVVCLFYLVPQMVGAGALAKPLLGLEHWQGVALVGVAVIFIVVSAGMVSTTWVQFIKGALLIVFCTILVVMVLARGITQKPGDRALRVLSSDTFAEKVLTQFKPENVLPLTGGWAGQPYVRLQDRSGRLSVWRAEGVRRVQMVWNTENRPEVIWPMTLMECQVVTKKDGQVFIDGLPRSKENDLKPGGYALRVDNEKGATGPVGPVGYLSAIADATIGTVGKQENIREADGGVSTVYYIKPVSGHDLLTAGASPMFNTLSLPPHKRNWRDQLNFVSLMLALFCGTASLPHILVRYYTVKDAPAAKKSTMVGILSIGFFYLLTLFLGLGAMTSGALDVTDSNMAAPLLARTFGETWFAVISAVAFTTVLGTVSGLIIAAAGAVAHDLISNVMQKQLTDHEKVRYGKAASIAVGLLAVVLGIVFKGFNVTFLVGWAFSVAASANLPALVMLLFWRGSTKQGIFAGIVVGVVSSVGWILLSGDAFSNLYGLPAERALVPFNQPGVVTIPLSFLVIWGVSMLSWRGRDIVAGENVDR